MNINDCAQECRRLVYLHYCISFSSLLNDEVAGMFSLSCVAVVPYEIKFTYDFSWYRDHL